MIYNEEDKKRIGKNLAAIRKAYGCSSTLEFALKLDFNGRYPGLSFDTLKKAESGEYPIKEQTIRLFASLTMFTYEKIVYEDLTDLEPNSLDLYDFCGSELLNDTDLLENFVEMLKSIFPYVSSKKAMKSKDFAKAYNICIKKLNGTKFLGEDVVEAVNLFSQMDFPQAHVNILSCLGRLYIALISSGMNQASLDNISNKTYPNVIEFAKKMYNIKNYDENVKFMGNQKRRYLEAYNSVLTNSMAKLLESNEYKDFAYYYLGVRYYFGIMDNDITKISDSDMNSFGINMLDCLEIMGNKYAIDFKKAFKE